MGGTWTGEGGVEYKFNVPISDQQAWYAANPPETIKALRPKLTQLPGFVFDGHGEPVNAVFELSCACGGAGFTVEGADGAEVQDPFSLRCAACGQETVIFDSRKHGYDGALGHNESLPPPAAERAELIANDIGDSPYRILVRYEYASDVMGEESFAEWKGRENALYTWFTLLARPMSGDAVEAIYDQECS
jgi:hypothetical protein